MVKKICMKSCLISECRMPKKTLHAWNNFLVYVLFCKLDFRRLFKKALLKIQVLNKEFFYLFSSSYYYSRLQSYDCPYCWPSVLLFNISYLKHVRRTVQKSIITNNFKAQFVIIKQTINELRFPVSVPHIESQLYQMILKSFIVYIKRFLIISKLFIYLRIFSHVINHAFVITQSLFAQFVFV